MSSEWESTMLLHVADEAYVRIEPPSEGREARQLVECPRCHRVTDWLIAACDDRVEVACRCGRRWQLAAGLSQMFALAECPPLDPDWACLDDARLALGFDRRADARRGRRR